MYIDLLIELKKNSIMQPVVFVLEEGWPSWFMALVLKTRVGFPYRGFESLSFRLLRLLTLYFVTQWFGYLRLRLFTVHSHHFVPRLKAKYFVKILMYLNSFKI